MTTLVKANGIAVAFVPDWFSRGIDALWVPPRGTEIGFLHSVLCQVGLPRSKTSEISFERRSGRASLLVEAGKLWNGCEWVAQPLPWGTKPRLMLADLCSYAVRHQTSKIDLCGSASEYLRRLGLSNQGGERGPLTAFRKQALALSACRMTLGFTAADKVYTVAGQPIKSFSAWSVGDPRQKSLWPCELDLSNEFYSYLLAAAVPLDMRAVQFLSSSALAMDLYWWLAHRLHRLEKQLYLHWASLRYQFGQEYADRINFKRAMLAQLGKVLAAYPGARVKVVEGGILLHPSPPPVERRPAVKRVGKPCG